MLAKGTTAQPILFTGATKTNGSWYGSYVTGTPSQNAVIALNYVTIEYGGASLGNLHLANAEAMIGNSTFRNSRSAGIHAYSVNVVSISDSAFTGNGGYAVNFGSGSANPVQARLTATGNGHDAVSVGTGTKQGAHVWEHTGIPYVAGSLEVAAGSTLTVELGVKIAFDGPRTLEVDGTLRAAGTAERRILFNSVGKTPGSWYGVRVAGTPAANANAVQSHATIEYGSTNIAVSHGRASVSHSIIRHSSGDGFVASTGGGGSVIETTQIHDMGGYGILNTSASNTVVLAANNNWGHPSGLKTDVDRGVDGAGSRVSRYVEYRPYLADPAYEHGFIAPSESLTLSLSPKCWFVPADKVTRAWVTMTLRDGAGRPVSGRKLTLHSTLGRPTPGSLRASTARQWPTSFLGPLARHS